MSFETLTLCEAQSRRRGRLLADLICRVAGVPSDDLEGLRAEKTLRVYKDLRAAEDEMAAVREGLTEALYRLVGESRDPARRGALLQLRRDVHNLRLPKSVHLEGAASTLPPDLLAGIVRFRALGLSRRQHLDLLKRTFDQEAGAVRRRFRRLVENADFRKGLLLSSHTLAGEATRYVRAVDAGRLRSKERQVERSLMRYYSRASMKATPFGTFCAILPGTFAAVGGGGKARPGFTGDPMRKRSVLRLNKALYARLLGRLLQRPQVRPHFHVELNPTLREEEGRWVFLSTSGGREVFQRLTPNPVLELLRDRFAGRAHLPLAALRRELCDDPAVEAREEEAEQYTDRLLEIGLIRFRIGIPEQEVDWDRPMRRILAPVDDEEAASAHRLLERLRTHIDAYSDAGVEERRELLAETLALLDDFNGLRGGQGWGKEIPPFYEDAGGEAELRLLAADREDLAKPLEEWVHLTSRLAWPRGEQATMRAFFDRFYGSDPGSVPLLRFYEEFYREHFKEHLERQSGGAAGARWRAGEERDREDDDGAQEREEQEEYDLANPFKLELLDRIQEARKRLSERVQELWRDGPEAEEITLRRKDLEAALAGVPEPGPACRSVSVFAQLLPGTAPDGGTALVANSYLNGYGKYFSRFLYLLPEEISQRLRSSNERLTGELLAEICGDAAFNANLHPPLLPWELSYPTGESGASEVQLPSPELEVEPDPADPDALRIIHRPSGKRVYPVDLGFLNPRMRPPLYQLLSRFTPPGNFSLPIPETPAVGERERGENAAGQGSPHAAGQAAAVLYRPRLSYEGRLVLARRRWTLGPASFPRREGHESDADYFLRMQRWREEHGLPVEVFVRIWPLPVPGGGEHTEAEGQAAPGPAERATAEAPEPVESGAEDEAAAEKETGEKHGEATQPPRPWVRQVRQHLYKPQYVDFRNPLLVDLFSRATENLGNFKVTLEERLPAREHLLENDGRRFATELVMQIDFDAPEEASDGD